MRSPAAVGRGPNSWKATSSFRNVGGANYRAACRARSRAEFVAKLGIVLEESDEIVFWLELLLEAGIGNRNAVAGALKEADELTSIFVSSLRTAKANA